MSGVVENPERIAVDAPQNSNVIELTSILKPISRNALILVNQEITIPNFKQLWKTYRLKVCGDGGANRLYDYFKYDTERIEYLPDFIIGDFDSLRDDVKEWYQAHGVGIIPQSTQWATDLNKCIDLVELYYDFDDQDKTIDIQNIDGYDGIIRLHETVNNKNPIQLVMVGAIDGRFDHTIHSITLLIKLAKQSPNLKAYFLTATDLIVLIPPGLHFLDYKETRTLYHGANVGLLPLNGPVVLNTKGLKWDVQNWPSSMSGDVSSSNRFVGEDGVVIETNDAFVMNIEISYERMCTLIHN